MAFYQTPPELGNQYTADRMMRSYLARTLPKEVLREIEPSLDAIGALAGGPLYRRSVEEGKDEPTLVQWDAWGNRIDQIDVSSLWKEAERITAEMGIVATAYERKHGEHSRVHQFSLVYLVEPSWHVYSCPLAMTDGAGRTLRAMGNQALVDRVLPRLTARDPKLAWTSGQWMTERTGGSDVALTETVAKPDVNGDFRLYGTKWFTSATTSQMALTLARPEGNPPGGKGLALFYVETRDAHGAPNGMKVNRLKDKLGTRMVPTAELTLEGTLATPVSGLTDGVKHIVPMLETTRTWNSVCAVALMRRGIALARDYSKKRVAFGAPLADKPLHADTLSWIEAEYQGAFLLSFRAVELMGREEAKVARDADRELFRILIPLAKLVTGKQAVAVTSEVLEAFGGAGYVEDTGLPRLLRDSQVLPIWEGTTNVLSLDVLRVLSHGGTLEPIEREIARCLQSAKTDDLRAAGEVARRAFAHAKEWIGRAMGESPAAVEQGARRFAMTLGRALELALLVDHASWALANGDGHFAAAARLFSRTSIDQILDGVSAQDMRSIAD